MLTAIWITLLFLAITNSLAFIVVCYLFRANEELTKALNNLANTIQQAAKQDNVFDLFKEASNKTNKTIN